MKKLPFILAAFVALVAPSIATANTIVIEYVSVDLPDLTPGEDLWQYQYTLNYTGTDRLAANQVVSIYFDYNRYWNLHNPTGPAGWNLGLLVVDPWLQSDGEFMLMPPVPYDQANPSAFSLDFIWLGPGIRPGSQPFEINQFSDTGGYEGTLESGRIVPAGGVIPEPGTLALVSLGLAAALIMRRKK